MGSIDKLPDCMWASWQQQLAERACVKANLPVNWLLELALKEQIDSVHLKCPVFVWKKKQRYETFKNFILQWEFYNMFHEKVFEIIKMGCWKSVNVMDYIVEARETGNLSEQVSLMGKIWIHKEYLKEIYDKL